MYHHSPGLLLAAELFFEGAYKNEEKCPRWLMAALKTSNHPCVIDGVIVTTNFTDLYGEIEEFKEPPSYDRADYNHILKRDSSKRCISATDEMMVSFVDVNRNFRVDISLHIVLLTTGTFATAIDVLDINIMSANLDSISDEFMVDWFVQRRQDIDLHLNRFKTFGPDLKIVVDNSPAAIRA